MSEISSWSSNLLAQRQVQKNLAKQLTRMQYIALVSKAAMDGVSDTYCYNGRKTAMTVAAATQLTQALRSTEIPPAAQAAHQQLTQDYLARMQQIAETTCARIVLEIERVPQDVGNSGFLDELRSALLGQ